MRQHLIPENFEEDLKDKWLLDNQGRDANQKYSRRQIAPVLKSFAQTTLREYDIDLFRHYRDRKYWGLGHDTIIRFFSEGPKGQDIVDLLCYYIYCMGYTDCVRQGLLHGSIPAYDALTSYDKSTMHEKRMSIGNRQTNIGTAEYLDIESIIKKKNEEQIQRELNKKLSKVVAEGIYTQYHLDRVDCIIYETKPGLLSLNDDDTYHINNINEWNYLFAKLNKVDEPSPAGGWYLIYEQRQFLQERLEAIFRDFKGDRISICEAGCASFVHHFTYVSIIIDALRKVGKDIKVELYVLDKFAYPLYQIVAVLEKVVGQNKIYPAIFHDSNPFPGFAVKADFINFLNMKFGLKYYYQYVISTKTQHCNLCRKQTLSNVKYDIITEHFLIRHEEDAAYLAEWLDKISDTYVSLAKDRQKLHLITAIGANAQDSSADYFDLYNKKGFRLEAQSKVWDIHDQNVNYGNQVDRDIAYPLKNYLLHWSYLKPI